MPTYYYDRVSCPFSKGFLVFAILETSSKQKTIKVERYIISILYITMYTSRDGSFVFWYPVSIIFYLCKYLKFSKWTAIDVVQVVDQMLINYNVLYYLRYKCTQFLYFCIFFFNPFFQPKITIFYPSIRSGTVDVLYHDKFRSASKTTVL